MSFGMICLIEKIIRDGDYNLIPVLYKKRAGAFASGFFDGRKRESFFLTGKAGGGTLNEIRWSL